jgi:hypothetical protein
MDSTDKRITFICSTCGSTKVTRDAWAEWDEASQQWVLGAAYDYSFCHDCENETRMKEVTLPSE